jgi:hypothetical protein
MPTKREEDAAAAVNEGRDPALPGAGWYPDPSYPTREWYWDGARWTRRHRKKPTPKPGWYPDPQAEGREWHWDGSAWTGRHRTRAKRNNFSSAYNLLPTWAQVTIPILAVIFILSLIAAAGEEETTSHPTGPSPGEIHRAEEEFLEELAPRA